MRRIKKRRQGGKGNEEGEEVFFGSSVANDFSSFIPMFIEATV